MKIGLACDHAGFELKEEIKSLLLSLGIESMDFGTFNEDSVDYPDYGILVAEKVSRGDLERGILICGTGIGMSIVANKFPRVRAALVHDLYSSRCSREHNDANVLTLGAGLIGVNLAKQILKTWLATEFAGGRHAQRVEKIISIEKSYAKEGKS